MLVEPTSQRVVGLSVLAGGPQRAGNLPTPRAAFEAAGVSGFSLLPASDQPEGILSPYGVRTGFGRICGGGFRRPGVDVLDF